MIDRSKCELIIDVRLVSKDGGDYCVRCPHCKDVIGIDGQDLSEIRGEQYRCRCGGWLEVTSTARFVRELPPHVSGVLVPGNGVLHRSHADGSENPNSAHQTSAAAEAALSAPLKGKP